MVFERKDKVEKMTSAITYLLNGQFLQAFFQVWTDVGVPNDIIYLVLISLAVTFVYIKTKEVGLVGLILLMTSSSLIMFVTPTTQIYFAGMLIFGIASLIYYFFKGH